jgi:signal transduction histidine kinase
VAQQTKQGGTSAFAADTARFNAYMSQASYYSTSTHHDSLQYYLQQAHTLARSISYSAGLSQYFHFITAQYNAQSQYDSAMHTALEELYWARKSKEPVRVAWAYNALANVYEYTGDMDSSARYFIKALDIAQNLKNEKLSGTLYYNLASVLFSIGDYARALDYARKGLAVAQRLNDVHMMSNCLLDIGSIQVGLNHYDTALAYFDRVIDMVRHTPDSLTILDALNNKGDVYAKEKAFSRSLAMYVPMLALAKQAGDPYYELYAYGNLGITQYQMHRLNEAAVNLKTAIRMAEHQHARNELRQFYEAYSEVMEAQKAFAPALLYRKKYDSLNEALMNEASKKNIHLLEAKYNTAQKDQQLARQQLALSRNQRAIEKKNAWLMLFIGGMVALAAILLLTERSHHHKKKLHAQSLLTLQKQHEVDTLQVKMDAREEERNRIGQEMHDDIGSALTTILYLSDDLKNDGGGRSQDTAARIAQTSGMVVDKMNEIIWSMNREYDTLDDLVAYTRQHAAQFLENHGLAYHFEVPDPVPAVHLRGEQRRNIFLVIKEALHNVVKHARATEVDIRFSFNGALSVIIQDNGRGIEAGNLRRFGNGLRNMRQRMEAVGGSFAMTTDQGTTITLGCPLERLAL